MDELDAFLYWMCDDVLDFEEGERWIRRAKGRLRRIDVYCEEHPGTPATALESALERFQAIWEAAVEADN